MPIRAWNAVKALSKTGAESVSKWKKKAAMSKLDAKSFQLDQTMKKADANLKKTVDKAKKNWEQTKKYLTNK
mgnify:CR=1 FL=1